MEDNRYSVKPLSAETWPDLVDLFGKQGASSGCWCMYFRQPHKEFHAASPEQHRAALEQVAFSGRPAGVLAYAGEQAVGWCAVAPRVDYAALALSRFYQPIDDQPVWSITCFFIRRGFRRKGVSRYLISEAVKYAASCGASIVEAYPRMDNEQKIQEASAYTGFDSVFINLGFTEAANRSGKNPILRYAITKTGGFHVGSAG